MEATTAAPPEAAPPPRSLEDVLRDPNTAWADIQAALRPPGIDAGVRTRKVEPSLTATPTGETATPSSPRAPTRGDRGEVRGSGARRGGPAKEGSCCLGGLKNVREEAEETVDGFDASSSDSGERRGRRLPTQRLRGMRSFRGSLRDVAEEAEAGMDEDEDAASGPGAASPAEGLAEKPRRRPHPVARKVRLPKSRDSTGKRSLIIVDSVNIMDFGVDHAQRPFCDSMLSMGTSHVSGSDSMTNLVDSDGFLSWDKSNGGIERKSETSNPMGRSESCDSNLSTLSNLVDSTGFLGWDSSYLNNSSEDLTVAHADRATNVKAEEDGPRPDARDYNDSEHSENSSRIEDYEEPTDVSKTRTSTGSGNHLVNPLKCLSLAGSDGTAAARCRAGAPRDALRTSNIKRLLLERRSDSDAGGAERRPGDVRRQFSIPLVERAARRASAFRGLLGREASAGPSAEEYACRRINRGDGVDIGELRRELHAAGSTEEGSKGRLNLAFF